MEASTPSANSWFANTVTSTGAQLLQSLAPYAVVVPLLFTAGTGAFTDDRINVIRNRQDVTASYAFHSYSRVRTPAEDLEQIRRVFSPSMSDLGKAFGVTRQAVYNWLKGDQPSPNHLDKLRDLALAAGTLAGVEVPIKRILLQREITDGKNLLQIAQVGGSTRDAALLLRDIIQREVRQRELLTVRFAGRTPVSSSDSGLMTESDAV
jgi:transcriptional regulator with XRE-family HTH domain